MKYQVLFTLKNYAAVVIGRLRVKQSQLTFEGTRRDLTFAALSCLSGKLLIDFLRPCTEFLFAFFRPCLECCLPTWDLRTIFGGLGVGGVSGVGSGSGVMGNITGISIFSGVLTGD